MGLISNVTAHSPITSTWGNAIRDTTVQITTSGARPSGPVEGQVIYETDTDKLMLYDGSGWTPLVQRTVTSWSPTITQGVSRSGTVNQGWYTLDGVWLSAQLKWTSSGAGSGAGLFISAPGSLSPIGTSENNMAIGVCQYYDTGVWYTGNAIATTSGIGLLMGTSTTDPTGQWSTPLVASALLCLNLRYRWV